MSHWISVALAWALVVVILVGVIYLIASTVRRSEDPAQFLFKWILTGVLVVGTGIFIFGGLGYGYAGGIIAPLTCAVLGIILSLIWTPHIAGWLFHPLTSAFDGGHEEWDPGPLYSAATGRRKRGLFQEAITAVEKQLARYPQDFQGQMLLAEIYADDLKDLARATRAVEEICRQPGHHPKNIAFALTQLADWQLKLGADSEAARASLQQIVDWFPGTEQALTAAHRLGHTSDAETINQMRDRTPVTLRPGVQNVGLQKQMPAMGPAIESPEHMAQRYVAHLQTHPLDQEVREKLGALYAEHYGRLDLAIDQLEQLIALPNQTPKLIARWLNQIADWHIRVARDGEAARLVLQRIVDLFPGLAVAETARQRLGRVGLEVKAQQPGAGTVKMGVYEQNIGLKQREGGPGWGARTGTGSGSTPPEEADAE